MGLDRKITYNSVSGFTLMELMLVVSVLGVLAVVGLPSLGDMVARAETNGASRELQTAFSLAKSEAIKRGQTVSLCASTAGTDCNADAWNNGWIVFVDANNDADGIAGSVDAGDTVLQYFDPTGQVTLTSSTDLMQFDYRGLGLNAATQDFKFCPSDNDADKARALEVSVTGRARVYYDGLDCP